MSSPDDRRYLESHEWHKLEGDEVTIGVSQFAVDELTDITYLEVTTQSGSIAKGDVLGEIESVKATSELYCGIDGEVVAVNQAVVDDPAKINEDPYGSWIIRVRPTDASQLDGLLSAEDYDKQAG